jgi:arylsulfatase A-like enzyme
LSVVSFSASLNTIIAFFAISSAVSSDRGWAASGTLDKPNIIVIVADDLGYADVGVQGCRDFPTPHLDSLARNGVRCTNGYVSCPVCGPTRAGLLAGRYQQRFGFEYNPHFPPQSGLPQTETTIGDLLSRSGYVTGAIGKWHLGKAPEFHPLECGFNEFYGFVGGGRSYFSRDIPIEDAWTRRFTPDDPLVRGHAQVVDPEYLTDAFGEEAVSFIERHKRTPFFLYVAFNAVHVPLQALERDLDRVSSIENKARRTYAAMMQSMDDAVGKISKKLQTEELDQSTLVFFLSDNGGHPLANAARNHPLRGQKSTMYEGGIRVPFFVKWTSRLPSGRNYPHPVISLDVLPTVLAAAGVDAPNGLQLDGVNLLPYLTGTDKRVPHETLFWRYGLHHAIRHGKWKLTAPANQAPSLYDLSTDISESQDLSCQYPEVAQDLKALYNEWDSQMESPRWRSLFMKDAPGPERTKKLKTRDMQ